jgi:hypothetical protein
MRTTTLLLALAFLATSLHAADPRNFNHGRLIPDEGYCDQPYIVITGDGNWLCTMTTGVGREGAGRQHVVATISSDQGRTWSPLIDIEPADGPAASWVVPALGPEGRVYALYNYDGDRVKIPEFTHTTQRRTDTLGWYVFKFSNDHGRTWSKERYRLPMPVAAVDRGNEWQGAVQLFWGIDKPAVVGGDVMFGLTRLGGYFQEKGEGWFYRSDNLLTERDPARIHWRLLPEAEHGLRVEAFGSTQEEHNFVPLANGDLYCMYRTRTGHPVQAYSRDSGRRWSTPEFATYTPGGRIMVHPRACPAVWRTATGKFLFWYHNNSYEKGPSNAPVGSRNVGWLTGGVERNGFIHWAQPEPVCYQPNRKRGASYPDLIEADGKYFLSATNKEEARLLEIDPALLEGMWHQSESKVVATRGLAFSLDATALERASYSTAMPRLASLAGNGGGFALDFWLTLDDLRAGQILLDSREQPNGAGLVVTTTENAALRLELSDGKNRTVWDSDAGVLLPGRRHHVVFNVDVAPRLITVIADGELCDGRGVAARPFGYTRFGDSDAPLTGKEVGDVSGRPSLKVAKSIMQLRVYSRYLTTSEAVANFRAGLVR